MKSTIIRWGATLGILGAIATTGLGQLKAWALSTQQIIQKLNPVPVFTIANDQGAPIPLGILNNENQEYNFMGIFISPQDAKNTLGKLQNQNPNLANKLQVVPVNLGKVYEFEQKRQEQGNDIKIQYLPSQEAINSAQEIMEQKGKKYQGGVPLFVATDQEKQQHLPLLQLTIEKESEKYTQTKIPLFFEKKELDAIVDQLKEQNPNLANTVNIDVVILEAVIDTLENNDSPILDRYVLMPSSESIEVVQQMLQNEK